ncbi:MAG: hypothetical protein K6F28_10000 [Lachnospiraceae bacterium]|nr:hypothetical protein [Lachnospiraceae bacterium]
MLVNAIKGFFRQPYIFNNVVGGASTQSLGSSSFERFFGRTAPNAFTNETKTTGTWYAESFVDVGFGDTPVTADDIKLADGNVTLENAYTTAISQDWTYRIPLQGKEYLTVIGQSNNSKSDNETINKTVVYRNDTDHNVTVKEIGFYQLVRDLAVTTKSNWDNQDTLPFVLGFRKVLENPITFAPGDVYAITYRIALDV